MGLTLEVGRTAVAAADLGPLLQRVCTALPRTLGVPAAAIVLVDLPDTQISGVTASGPDPARLGEMELRAGTGPVQGAVRSGRAMVTPDLTRIGPPELAAAAADTGLTSSVVVPLRVDGEPAGGLQLFGHPGRPVGEGHVDALAGLADMLSARLGDACAVRRLTGTVARLTAEHEAAVPVAHATGMLAERYRTDPEEAQRYLESLARKTDATLPEAALAVLERRDQADAPTTALAAVPRPAPRGDQPADRFSGPTGQGTGDRVMDRLGSRADDGAERSRGRAGGGAVDRADERVLDRIADRSGGRADERSRSRAADHADDRVVDRSGSRGGGRVVDHGSEPDLRGADTSRPTVRPMGAIPAPSSAYPSDRSTSRAQAPSPTVGEQGNPRTHDSRSDPWERGPLSRPRDHSPAGPADLRAGLQNVRIPDPRSAPLSEPAAHPGARPAEDLTHGDSRPSDPAAPRRSEPSDGPAGTRRSEPAETHARAHTSPPRTSAEPGDLRLASAQSPDLLSAMPQPVSRSADQNIHASGGPGLRGESPRSHGEAAGSRGEAAGLHGEALGARGEAPGLRSETQGSRGETPRSRGEALGLRSESSGSRGETPGQRGEAPGSRGETSGLRGDEAEGHRTDPPRPVPTRDGQGARPGEQQPAHLGAQQAPRQHERQGGRQPGEPQSPRATDQPLRGDAPLPTRPVAEPPPAREEGGRRRLREPATPLPPSPDAGRARHRRADIG